MKKLHISKADAARRKNGLLGGRPKMKRPAGQKRRGLFAYFDDAEYSRIRARLDTPEKLRRYLLSVPLNY